jgi:cyclin A
MHVLCKMNLKEQLDKKIYTYLEKICIYLAKMVLYDYDLINGRGKLIFFEIKDYSLLSGSLIFVAFKIIE